MGIPSAFAIDTYGEDSIVNLFVSIGNEKDLEKSLRSVFNKSINEIEAKWFSYIKNFFKPLKLESRL